MFKLKQHIQLYHDRYASDDSVYVETFRKEGQVGGGYTVESTDFTQYNGTGVVVLVDNIDTERSPAPMHEAIHARWEAGTFPPSRVVDLDDELLISPYIRASVQPLFDELRVGLPNLWDLLPVSRTGTNIIPWDYCQNLAAEHIRKVPLPTDSGFNLITFIRESVELKGLMLHIMRYKKTLKRLISAFRYDHGAQKGYHLKDAIRIIANEHLTWAFGFLPLISDINKVLKILANHEKTLREIVTGAQKTYRYGFQNIKSKFTLPADPGIIGTFRGAGKPWKATYQWSIEPEWKGYYTYFIRAPLRVTRPYGGFLVLLDTLGVHPDPQIVWDAIPFSFVLDWILDIGETLHKNRFDLVPLTMNVTDAMHHVRFALTRVYWFQSKDGTFTPIMDETYTVFQRQRFIAEPETRQGIKQLGIDKLLLGASLAATR